MVYAAFSESLLPNPRNLSRAWRCDCISQLRPSCAVVTNDPQFFMAYNSKGAFFCSCDHHGTALALLRIFFILESVEGEALIWDLLGRTR
jgi:hypothetical protein